MRGPPKKKNGAEIGTPISILYFMAKAVMNQKMLEGFGSNILVHHHCLHSYEHTPGSELNHSKIPSPDHEEQGIYGVDHENWYFTGTRTYKAEPWCVGLRHT